MNVHIHTTWGDIQMNMTDGKINACHLPTRHRRPGKPFKVTSATAKSGSVDRKTLNAAKTFIQDFMRAASRASLAFDFPEGPAFHRKVWKALLRIPAGRTLTYGAIARQIGHPRAARAVGQACGANPLPLIIPCHRVTAANGQLGGFSCGLAWKEHLLERERSVLSAACSGAGVAGDR